MSNLQVINLLVEYFSIVDETVGIFIDATRGFSFVLRDIISTQMKIITKKNMTMDELNRSSFSYGIGAPGTRELHRRTQGEVKERNSTQGPNSHFLANLCLVSIYQYWENHYRQQLAKASGKSNADMQIDIMGDLGLIRGDILHHRGIATKKIDECRILKWFRVGDRIQLDLDQLIEIEDRIHSDLNAFFGIS